MVNIGGICEFDWQCNGTKFANVCDRYHGVCLCSPGYINIDRKCYPGKICKVKIIKTIYRKKCQHSCTHTSYLHILKIGLIFFSLLLFKS